MDEEESKERKKAPPPVPLAREVLDMTPPVSATPSHSGANNNNSSKEKKRKIPGVLTFGRIMFMLCLSAVAIVLGYLVHLFLVKAETELAETQFESIADRAMSEAAEIVSRSRWTMATMAEMAGQAKPDPDDWPFVYVPGYEEIGTKLQRTVSEGEVVAMAPLVEPHQLQEWEDYAYNYFENVTHFPNGTGMCCDWGKGVWKIDRTRDTTGIIEGSPYQVIFPTFQTQIGPDAVLMFSLRSDEIRRAAIDPVIRCSEQRAANMRSQAAAAAAAANGTTTEEPPATAKNTHSCASITDMVSIIRFETRGPAAVMYEPVYPANGNGILKGLMATLLLLDVTLDNVFADEVRGVDCVIRSKNNAYTYSVMDGVAHPKGEGDLHDHNYNRFAQSTVLTNPDFYTEESQIFTLTVYPTDELYNVYRTSNPRIATAVTVSAIIVTTLFFFAFDCFVRKEFKAKKNLLEAKRRFMRFVSHEVRTPLNSVCMGLTLIELELGSLMPLVEGEKYEENGQKDNTHPQPEQYLPRGKRRAVSLPSSSSVGGGGNAKATAESHEEKVSECIHLAREIQTQANSAVDILNDLLNYDKIENGTLSMEFSFAPIWKLVERTVKEFTLPTFKKDISLTMQFQIHEHGPNMKEDEDVERGMAASVESADALPDSAMGLRVIADIVRITQSIRNLLSNAVKFTPEGGTITVRTVWTDGSGAVEEPPRTLVGKVYKSTGPSEQEPVNRGTVSIHVEDSGAGMDSDQLSKLFRPGVQFNSNNLQAGGGSGLGLYIAKGIVDEHKGTLSVKSDGLGQGTTFTITLPVFSVPLKDNACSLRPMKKAQNVSGSDNAVATEAEAEATSLKILIVDDAATNRKLLCRLLRREGHVCHEAPNGRDAVDAVVQHSKEARPYDTILLDYEMPEMNGPTAARKIRSLGYDVFIVGITGNMLPEDVSFFRSSGANAVLPKPIKLADLRSVWLGHGLTDGSCQGLSLPSPSR